MLGQLLLAPLSQVFCNGEEVLTTSGTQAKYTVDIWSGNHPFFKGSSASVVVDEGRVNRFKRRYAGLDGLSDMSTMKQGARRCEHLLALYQSQCCVWRRRDGSTGSFAVCGVRMAHILNCVCSP